MIGNAIYALLSGHAPLQTLTGGRITSNVIPQAQPVPCVYYATDDIEPLPVRNAMGVMVGTLEVGFQTDTYAGLDALDRLVRDVLENFKGVRANYRLQIGTGNAQPDYYDETLRLHGRAIDFQLLGQSNQ